MLGFQDIYGNERLKERLLRTVRSGNVLNSYVFEGADGIGKKTTADIFAAALLCGERENAPCGQCEICAKTGSHNHPDVIYVRKKKDKATVGIDDVREQVMETVYVKPLLADRKIFIIEDGGALTAGAQNGLLKILEEPPAYAVFLILVPKAGMLLDTVLSRSVVCTFLPLPYAEVYRYFCKHMQKPEEQLQFAARFSQGVIGRGLMLLEDGEYMELYSRTTRFMELLLRSDEAVTDFERFLLDHKDKLDFVIDFMLIFLRDCVLCRLNMEEQVLCRDKLYEIKSVGAAVSKKALVSAMDCVLRYQKRTAANANASVSALELLMSIREEMDDKGYRCQV